MNVYITKIAMPEDCWLLGLPTIPCSLCGHQEVGGLQNYCPNCGADMYELAK